MGAAVFECLACGRGVGVVKLFQGVLKEQEQQYERRDPGGGEHAFPIAKGNDLGSVRVFIVRRVHLKSIILQSTFRVVGRETIATDIAMRVIVLLVGRLRTQGTALHVAGRRSYPVAARCLAAIRSRVFSASCLRSPLSCTASA